jgi:perosamine synthetase
MNKAVYDIPWAKPNYWGNERKYVLEALDSSWISGGGFVDRLERDFSDYCGAPAIACANGTAALHLIYLGLGIEPGDEIVVPGFGFLAAANIALHVSAKPVFCEVDPDTWCARAQDIARVLSPRTKAIVTVHTYGNVCEMDAILDLGRKKNIPIIEDVAEAFPSRYRGRIAGTFGAAGCFSFQATKTITTGEGGMVVTADDALRRRMELYRSHGLMRKRHYWHELPGHNFRLTNLQAALGCAQLEKLDAIVFERQRVCERYSTNLENLPGIVPQHFPADVEPVVWAIAVRLDPAIYPQGRDRVMAQMQDLGIETRPGFYPPSALDYFDCPALPISETLAYQIISLPSYPTLDNSKIEIICDTLAKLRKN